MQRYSAPALVMVAVFAFFWAYTVAGTLLTEFADNVTWIDLGVLFVLGAIAGAALASAAMLNRRQRR